MARARRRPKPAPQGDYWDAMVFLDYITSRTTPEGKQAVNLWDEVAKKGGTIHTSVITIAEVAFFLAGETTLTDEQAAKIDALWHPQGIVQLWAVTPEIARDARGVKRDCATHNPSIPIDNMDAIHIATAKSIPVARLITNDHFKYKREQKKTTALGDQRPNLEKLFGIKLCSPKPMGMQFTPVVPPSDEAQAQS